MPRRRVRKQRVVLRQKRRVALHRRMSGLLFMAGLIGISAVLIRIASSETAWAPSYLKRHTPTLELKAPETLAALPLLKEKMPTHFTLWLPGAEWRLRRQWMKQYPAVSDVVFEKHFLANRIVAHLEPRIPLVKWEEHGVDKNGAVFELLSPSWAPLPKAMLRSNRSLPVIGPWLSEVSQSRDLWTQVVAISEDLRGDMWLDIQTGTHVAWGAPDVRTAKEKARCLMLVLNDAHARLSGASSADLRFFEDGRVIVMPKTGVGRG